MFVQAEADGAPTVYAPKWAADAILKRRVVRAEQWLRRRGCDRIELEIWRPELAVALDWVRFTTSTYHIDDEYSWSETPQPLSALERSVIERVDRVFVTSPALLETKGGINPQTIFSPNGVDFARFSAPRAEPADLAAVPHPRIGFAGVLRRGLDWELLTALAKRRPDWSLVFVGGVREGHATDLAPIEAIRHLPNVHLLGEKNADDLPAYVQHFDVAALAYRRLAYLDAINPLKLYEALATGIPVVGAKIPALEALRPVVSTASGIDEWERAVRSALETTHSDTRRAERQALARKHDWDAIATAIGDEIAIALRLSS